MAGLSEISSSIIAQATRRVEISAQNMSNITTPGYKRRVSFVQILEGESSTQGQTTKSSAATDFSIGKIVETGNPSDLAVTGRGFFVVATQAGQLVYTRQGQFHRDADGRLVTAAGQAVQADGGGDLVLRGDDYTVTADGVVLEKGEPRAKLAIMDLTDPMAVTPAETGGFTAPEGSVVAVSRPSIRQGALESSNVSNGDEMVAVMEALRRAEAGQRLINVYDDLMGRALTAFGQT